MTNEAKPRRLFAFYTKRTGLVAIPVAPKLREDSKDLESPPPFFSGDRAAKGVTFPTKETP